MKFNKDAAFNCGIPEHMIGALQRWIENGIAPGSFLSAVLKNDLMGALGQADHINMNSLPAYAQFLYNHTPSISHGSVENFEQWERIHKELKLKE